MPLYLVATPIGNLEDITLRALRVLREVGLIAAEDTRTTRHLLQHYQIETPVVSFHEFSSRQRLEELLERLQVGDVALVSDAGTPGLSDPGYPLIQQAIQAKIPIIPIPGATAAITALVASGLPTDNYLFLGFLPRRSAARQQALVEVAHLPYTLVLYESPHRLPAFLAEMEEILGNRWLCVGRELTKLYEEIWRGTVQEARNYFVLERIRGEFTLVVAGMPAQTQTIWSEEKVRQLLLEKMTSGLSHKEAAALVANLSGWQKRQVYDLGNALKQN